MTPQLEVLKHLGHALFDDNRSAELKRFYHNGKIASILLICNFIAVGMMFE